MAIASSALEIPPAHNRWLKYYRTAGLPTMWCPGCGIGIVVQSMVRAIDKLGLDQDKVVIVTGIGCSGAIYNYLDFDAYHGTHGRALPAATGIKLADPSLHVIVPMGDGDCLGIGGNHFIHACRRNVDVTAIILNNQNYGQTGGQGSPTTPTDAIASTSPYGHLEQAFDPCDLAIAAGATYVARGTAYHATQLTDLITNGIQHRGFSVIEARSPCPVQFGHRNELGSAVDMLRSQKEQAINVRAAEGKTPEELKDRIVMGELRRIEAPETEYTYRYDRLIERAQTRAKPRSRR